MRSHTSRSYSITSAAVSLLLLLAVGAAGPATEPQARAADTPLADPRPGLIAFFDAVRAGNEDKAVACWFDDVEGDDMRKNVNELVRDTVREAIATARFSDAVRRKLPAEFAKARHDHAPFLMPDDAQIAHGQFTVYRRLAICSWGNDEDDGYPMVLDNFTRTQKLAEWKISMQQWYETNRSSVGDSMLQTGWEPKALDQTTKEILAGKFKNLDEIQAALTEHLLALANRDDSATTQPSK